MTFESNPLKPMSNGESVGSILQRLTNLRFHTVADDPQTAPVRYVQRTRSLFAINLDLTRMATRTTMMRLLRGPQKPTWSWQFESIAAFMRSLTSASEQLTADDLRTVLGRVEHLPLPADIQIQRVDAGGVPGEWLVTPRSRADRVMLYLHGGGYVAGSARSHRGLVAELARVGEVCALSLDYRLAPEHPYPAALEDALTAYYWLLESAMPPTQIVLAGDSAGGSLCLTLLLALRDAGAALPAATVAISPFIDVQANGDSVRANNGYDFLNPVVLRRCGELYLAGGGNPRDPLVSPRYAQMHDLPPLLVQAGTAELLYDDIAAFAQQAARTGANIEFEPWENMIHVWPFLYLIEPLAEQAILSAGRFMRQHLPEK